MDSIKTLTFFTLTALMLISIPPVSAASLGDEWNSIKSSLQSAEKAETIQGAMDNLNSAKATYANNFKLAAQELDPESNQIIENAFSKIEQHLNAGESFEASLQRQAVDKTIYTIAYLKIEQALDNGDADSFLNWFDVMEKKFKISEKDFETNHAVEEIASDASEIPEYSDTIKNELLGIFKLKTIEEVEEAIAALDAGNVNDARKFAYEGFYYYRTLHPSVLDKLGADAAAELLNEMDEVIEVTGSDMSIEEMKAELEHIAEEVELLIREYEGGDTSEVGFALSGIKDRLNLVSEEYSEAVSGGIIVDQEEYDETVVFLNKAISILAENRESFVALSEPDVVAMETNLNEIKSLVESFDDPDKVTILVGKSLNNIANLEELAGGATEITAIQYIDNIKALLTETKSVYRNGDSQMAFDLASEAYLDNYEFVEAPLGEIDHELMEKIENDMRITLRDMIQNGESPDAVDAHIDMILADLETARNVVPEFGPLVLIILAAGISAIIFATKKN